MSEDVTKSIKMDLRDPNVVIQICMLAKHGKTMLCLHSITDDDKYLKQAELDYHRAKSLQECGFVRPLGVLLTG